LPVGQVRKEAPCPVGVAAFGAMRVVPGSDALPKLLERWQRIASALLVDDGTHGLPMPVRPLEEVHEVDAQCLLRLTYLPFLTPPALELLAEQAHLVGQRPVRGRACQELPHPAHAVGRRPLLHQARPQDELAELLQRRLRLPHGPPLPGAQAWEMPGSAERRGRPSVLVLTGFWPGTGRRRHLPEGRRSSGRPDTRQHRLTPSTPPRNPRAMPPAPFRGSRLGTRPEGALSMPIVSKAAAAGQCSPGRGGDQARQMSQQRARQIGAVQPYDVGRTFA